MSEVELLSMVLRPDVLDEVAALIQSLELEIFSVSIVQGVGRQRGHTEIFRGREYNIETQPKVRVDVLVEDSDAKELLIQRVSEHVYTGHVGDGKIFVFRGMVPTGLKFGRSAA